MKNSVTNPKGWKRIKSEWWHFKCTAARMLFRPFEGAAYMVAYKLYQENRYKIYALENRIRELENIIKN
ncbi:hypothetical protein [Komagataeibacter swingsii]|uniref:hypothetical protein n=1 Tax=Komagataeibacter swingsii TaxID=215220 RepID=UPI0011B547D8|nr:hypothetical protein [Komagataeibacter swingsii]GBQ64450.1 hypothetical protein AA16373_2904 [Komagataeibacter swingsii DSM 16373]